MISKVGNVNNKKIMLEKQKLQASTSYFSQDISIFLVHLTVSNRVLITVNYEEKQAC